MTKAIKSLIISIDELIALDKPEADEEMLYDVVFKTHSEVISPMIEKVGMNFKWSDPDTSYREDVDAYLGALKDFKKRLETLIVEKCSECHQSSGYHKMDCSHRLNK